MRACDSFSRHSLKSPLVSLGDAPVKLARCLHGRKLQDPVAIFQLVGASCFGDIHYVPPLRDDVMSHDANANATFVTFWFARQWEVLTHIYPITVNGGASN